MRCKTHRSAHEKRRGTRQQRGYDATHDRTRTQWEPRVATGTVNCARCHNPITPGQAWHLDHTDDRTTYLGPSHQHCNTSAGGTKAHSR
jgi:hypothetical protein